MSKNNISIKVIDNYVGTDDFNYKAIEDKVNILSANTDGPNGDFMDGFMGGFESDSFPFEEFGGKFGSDHGVEIGDDVDKKLIDGDFLSLIEPSKSTYKPEVDENVDTIGISYASMMNTIMSHIDDPTSLKNEFLELTMDELKDIGGYYELRNSRSKDAMIEKLVHFECDMENIELVFRRRKLWFFMNEIREDNYLNKYILTE